MKEKKNQKFYGNYLKAMFILSSCTFGGGFVIVSLMKKKFVEELKVMVLKKMKCLILLQ